MGNFYTNVTLRGPTPQAVAGVLAGRTALITPERSGCVVVYDQDTEEQDFAILRNLGATLSRALGCPALAALDHDDDMLMLWLFEQGKLVDEYCSNPGFGSGDVTPPSGGAPKRLCAVFAVKDPARVAAILRAPTGDEPGGYAFAADRHADLVAALGTSPFAVGAGYEYAASGELPEGLDAAELIRTGDED